MICVANWKMNQTPQEVQTFIQELKKCSNSKMQKSLILLLPALYVSMVKTLIENMFVLIGGQNCHFKNQGAFTGENSPKHLYELGARYCLVGHSERRMLFQEDSQMVYKKFQAIQANGMKPILCVGETLEQYQKDQTLQQLESQLQLYRKETSFFIAYEPIWAIGSGQVASFEHIQKVVSYIQKYIHSHSVSILYGGSVHAEQVDELSQIEFLSGWLIGSQSLNCQNFLNIYHQSNKNS